MFVRNLMPQHIAYGHFSYTLVLFSFTSHTCVQVTIKKRYSHEVSSAASSRDVYRLAQDLQTCWTVVCRMYGSRIRTTLAPVYEGMAGRPHRQRLTWHHPAFRAMLNGSAIERHDVRILCHWGDRNSYMPTG